jgi:hypothetical protein
MNQIEEKTYFSKTAKDAQQTITTLKPAMSR